MTQQVTGPTVCVAEFGGRRDRQDHPGKVPRAGVDHLDGFAVSSGESRKLPSNEFSRQPDRITIAHGRCFESNASEVLRRLFRSLL